MPPDPEKTIECRGCLDRAWADIDSAVILLGASRPRPHNLRELGEACAGLAGSLRDLAQKAEDLTQFAWVFRYPGEPEVPTLAGGATRCRWPVRSMKLSWRSFQTR